MQYLFFRMRANLFLELKKKDIAFKWRWPIQCLGQSSNGDELSSVLYRVTVDSQPSTINKIDQPVSHVNGIKSGYLINIKFMSTGLHNACNGTKNWKPKVCCASTAVERLVFFFFIFHFNIPIYANIRYESIRLCYLFFCVWIQ